MIASVNYTFQISSKRFSSYPSAEKEEFKFSLVLLGHELNVFEGADSNTPP